MPVRSLFLDHLWLKAFSFILATLLWLTIHSKVEREPRMETKTFDNERVGFYADPSEHRTFVLDPAVVRVTVTGPKTVIDNLRDIHAYVELASHAGNTGNYSVEVHVPAGVTVIHVAPKTVFVRQETGTR